MADFVANKQDNDGSPFGIQETKSVAKVQAAADKAAADAAKKQAAEDAKAAKAAKKKKGGGPQPVTRAAQAEPAPKITVRAWKKMVIDRLKETGHTSEADYLTKNWGDDDNISNDDAFSKVWGEQAGLTSKYSYAYLWDAPKDHLSKATSNSLGGALQGNDKDGNKIKGKQALMNDATYQEITSVSRTRPNGKVGGPGADDNYAVWPNSGRLIKVEYGNPPSTHWMPSDDTNPAGETSGEVSYHAATAYGSTNSKSDAGALSPAAPGYLSNDQWDFIGQNNLLLRDGKHPLYPNNQQEFDEACKKRNLTYTPPKTTASTGGGPKLLNGFPTVVHGGDQKCIGYANADSRHAAGGCMVEGSNTVFVGQFPVSRVGDATSDDMVAVSGATDCFVG